MNTERMMPEDIEAIRRDILEHRFSVWDSMMRDLERTADPNRSVVRFPNSSTYVFSTGPASFWMMDPCYNLEPCRESERKRIAEMIREKISFILITHLHEDHCQRALVEDLKDAPIRWVVSERCRDSFAERFRIPGHRVEVLADGHSAEISGIRIESQCGYHDEPGISKVPGCSFDILLPDGIRLFFPSDVRNYGKEIPHREQPADYIFGHVFLGREDARGSRFSQLDAFCRFMTCRKSAVLFLTHLYSTGRLPRDLWTHRHARMIEEKLRTEHPELKIIAPHFGDIVPLVAAARPPAEPPGRG